MSASGRVHRSPRPMQRAAPRAFVPAVRSIVTCYMVAILLFTGGVLVQAWRPFHA